MCGEEGIPGWFLEKKKHTWLRVIGEYIWRELLKSNTTSSEICEEGKQLVLWCILVEVKRWGLDTGRTKNRCWLTYPLTYAITENESNWSHGPQPCLTQWNYEPRHVGPPKMDGSWCSDQMRSTGEGNGKPLQYSCLENPMNSMKRQKDMTMKDELPRSVGAQYASGEEWRNSSRKNKEMKPKWKQCPIVNMTGDGSKVQCCKEQYCIGTQNVRSMNQGKLEVVKQEMARVNIDILRISELKWSGISEFNSDDNYI